MRLNEIVPVTIRTENPRDRTKIWHDPTKNMADRTKNGHTVQKASVTEQF